MTSKTRGHWLPWSHVPKNTGLVSLLVAESSAQWRERLWWVRALAAVLMRLERCLRPPRAWAQHGVLGEPAAWWL